MSDTTALKLEAWVQSLSLQQRLNELQNRTFERSKGLPVVLEDENGEDFFPQDTDVYHALLAATPEYMDPRDH